jgi:hypothetical protein
LTCASDQLRQHRLVTDTRHNDGHRKQQHA